MPIRFLNRTRGSGTGTSSFYDFTLGALPGGVTFTRASAGYRYNSSGVLVSEATDVPRFNYSPATLAARGLLIEGAATNSFIRSDAFDNASWAKTRCSAMGNAIASPDGTTNADQLVEDTNPNSHYLALGGLTWAIGEWGVITLYAKANTRNWLYLQLPTAFGTERAFFDVLNGVVGTKTAGTTAFIENVGGGWFRCMVLAQATVATSTQVVIGMASADNMLNYTGDGASNLYLYGATYSKADCVTSYIATAVAAATRAGDVALITNGAALGDQCCILKARTPRKVAGGAVNVLFQVDDGTPSNNRRIIYGTDGRIRVVVTAGGVDQCDLDLGAVPAGTDIAVAARFADNNFAASLNGGAIVTDTSGVNPLGMTTARLGKSVSGYEWNGTIRSLKHQSTATDAELPLLAA